MSEVRRRSDTMLWIFSLHGLYLLRRHSATGELGACTTILTTISIPFVLWLWGVALLWHVAMLKVFWKRNQDLLNGAWMVDGMCDGWLQKMGIGRTGGAYVE